jgi:hypothetical protein
MLSRERKYRRLAENAVLLAALTASLSLAVVACRTATKAGPPYLACGQEISNFTDQPVLNLHPGETVGGLEILVLVSGCTHGAEVTITPPTVAQIVGAVHTTDGKFKAIELNGTNIAKAQGKLTLRQDQRLIGEFTVCGPYATGICSPPPPPTTIYGQFG